MESHRNPGARNQSSEPNSNGPHPTFEPQIAGMAPGEPRPSLQPRFQFIDEGGTESKDCKQKRKAIRRHVMTEHMRQKRWKEKGQLDPKTVIEQRGLQDGILSDQSSSANTGVAIRPSEVLPEIAIPKPDDEEIEEIPRSQDQGFLSQPYQPFGGKTPDEIDALLASAISDKNVFASYFDLQPPASNQWQPPPAAPNTFPPSIPKLFVTQADGVSKPRQDSIESNPVSIPVSEDVPEETSDYSPSPTSDQGPRTPSPPTEINVISPRAETSLTQSPSPRTYLSATRKDPFGTLPLRLKEHEHELVDHFIMIMPFDYYGVTSRRELAFNWFRDVIFPVAMKSPISFRTAVLGFACIHKARLQGVLTTPELTRQGMLGLQLLNERFQNHPDDGSDEAIANCMIQSVFEDFSPGIDRKAHSWLHMRQAMRMIRSRGGPSSIQHSPRLTMLANCYDYRSPGYYGEGLSFSFKNYPPTTFSHLGPNPDPISLGTAELRMVLEEFIDFLRSVEHLSLVQRSDTYAELSPRRHRVFQPGTSLHAIIASPPAPRRSISGYQHQVTYGISILVHLNAALWDFRRDAERSERFLKDVCLRIVANELDTYISVEALAQLMLRPISDPDMRQQHFDRLWFVGRMIKIAKRLSLESWLRLRGMLIGFLTFKEMPSFFEWEDEFRREVLAAPLTSFIMPALMVPAIQTKLR